MPTHIVNVGYDAANCYVVVSKAIPRLIVDCAWPNSIGKLLGQMKNHDIWFDPIKHFMVTHFHPDHAGLVKDLKHLGLRLVILDTQIPTAEEIADLTNRTAGYMVIQQKDALTLKPAQSREFLKQLQIDGQIVSTPGHSDDSVSLVLDEGIAFTGDLTVERLLSEKDSESRASWDTLRTLGVRLVYGGHGAPLKLT